MGFCPETWAPEGHHIGPGCSKGNRRARSQAGSPSASFVVDVWISLTCLPSSP